MPIKNDKIFCINHPDTQLIQNLGFNALVTVERTELGTRFVPNSGIPVVAHTCPLCGYVEMYVAQKTPEWLEAISPEKTQPSGIFERDLIDEIALAIKDKNSPFHAKKTLENPVFNFGAIHYEADLLVETRGVVYIIEVKVVDINKKSSLSLLEKTAIRLREYTRRMEEEGRFGDKIYFPLLVVPEKWPYSKDIFRGVPVLVFDRTLKKFSNLQDIAYIFETK